MQTHYQHLEKKIQVVKKDRKKLNAKITKQLNNETVNPSISALSKDAHNKLIDIITLKDEQSKIPG